MQRFYSVLCVVLLLLLVACTSSEEKARRFLENGQALLAAGEPVKAKLEFQNALQLDEKLIPAWYGMSQIAEQQGDIQGAFALLNRVIDIDPRHLEAQVRRGRLLLIAGELDAALKASNAAFELAPEDASALSLRAAVFFRLDDAAGAIALAQKALEVQPGEANALMVLASERMAAEDMKQALTYLDKGIAGDEKNVGLQLLKIEALSRLGETESAERVYRRLIELHPDTVAYRHAFAMFYLAQSREADAEQIYRDIVSANPGDVKARIDLIRFVTSVRGSEAAIVEVQQNLSADPGNVQLLFILAQLQQSENQPELAQKTLQSVVEKAESSEDKIRAKGLLATHHMLTGEAALATALVKDILAEDPRNEQALILQASQLIEERKLDEAISDLRTVLRDTPDSTRAILLLAKAHELTGATEMADDMYGRAFQASQLSPDYGLHYAEFLLKSNRAAQASEVLEEGLRVSPDHMPSLTLLARTRVALGDWAGAQSVADHIQKLDDSDAISQQIMGTVYAAQQNYGQSATAFEQAYQASPSAVQPMVSLVRVYERAGKAEEAHKFLDTVLAANPDNDSALLLKGQLYISQGDYESATGLFRAVVKRAPTNITAYQNLAGIEMRRGQADAAMAILEEGLAANQGNFNLRLAKAGVLEEQGRVDEAIAVYEELIAERPNADVIANNLASLLSDHRDDDTSLRRAQELAARFRTSDIPYFKDTLGWAYFRLGDMEQASELIEDAAQEMPAMPIFHYHLGMVYLAMNEKDAARRELDKALELAGDRESPFHDEVKEAIKRL
jgi:tetratricopeptide (TPR) repeat protein